MATEQIIHTAIYNNKSGVKSKVYSESSAVDVKVDKSGNSIIPESVKTMQDIVDKLGSGAFGEAGAATGVMRNISIPVASWNTSNKNYSITNPNIHSDSIIDVYYSSDSVKELLSNTITYTQAEGSMTIKVETIPTKPITITAIRITN